jgi:cell division protein FtsB
MAGAAAADGTQKGKKKHQFLVGVTLSVGLVLAFLVLFSHQSLYRIYRLRLERQSLEQETARLAAENGRLTRTIDRLQHDPEMIQDLIRRELNFVKKNDIIFQLPPEARKNQAQARAQANPRRSRPGAGGKNDRPRSVSGPPQGAP